jgi:hypothetical protein
MQILVIDGVTTQELPSSVHQTAAHKYVSMSTQHNARIDLIQCHDNSIIEF